MDDRIDAVDVWFEPKRYGYGAGPPVRWQGWALLGGFLLLIFGMAATIAERHPLLYLGLAVLLTAALLVVTARHTRGGWRWRWGEGA